MRNIRRKAFDMKSLRLSPEEGFVLSRLDAPLTVRELVALTGLEEGRIVEIVEGLATQGAIDVDREAASAPAAPAAAPPPAPVQPQTLAAAAAPEGVASEAQAAAPAAEASEAQAAGSEPTSEAEAEASDGEASEDAESPEDAEKRAAGEREYRKIYETKFRPLERDARAAAAETAQGSELFALCLDPDPQVIAAVLANHHAGLAHARVIASQHHTYVGLDHVGRRSEYLKDAQVQRRLLANPQLPDPLLRRIVNPKLLHDVYKICVDREFPEMARMKTRELLQKKFMLASADERAALLFKTEGRCLVVLTGVALDARTTQILTSKTTYTVLFIQNLARWSATPPALLTHLLKQPLVRQNIGLRKMVLKHPNTPSEAKRNLS